MPLGIYQACSCPWVQKEVVYQFGNSPMKFVEQTRASPTSLGLLAERHVGAMPTAAKSLGRLCTSGQPDSVIKEITRHSRNQVTDRYDDVSMEDKKQVVERLAQYRKGQIANVTQNVTQTASLASK
jgi:hypothetical protein